MMLPWGDGVRDDVSRSWEAEKKPLEESHQCRHHPNIKHAPRNHDLIGDLHIITHYLGHMFGPFMGCLGAYGGVLTTW